MEISSFQENNVQETDGCLALFWTRQVTAKHKIWLVSLQADSEGRELLLEHGDEVDVSQPMNSTICYIFEPNGKQCRLPDNSS